jgi:hypothetical protein
LAAVLRDLAAEQQFLSEEFVALVGFDDEVMRMEK